jgi:EAL domain-containing protein (putative c-di-GMP-specific phosphodiesterase class I)
MNAPANGFVRENLEAQVAVFQTGDSGDAAYVIESGCVEVLAGPPDAQRRVAVLAEGAMFGEVALLDHQPRTATVRTLMPTSLVRIDRTHVEELLGRADPVIQYLLRLLLERFRNSSSSTKTGAQEPPGATDAHSDTPRTSPQPDLHAAAVRTLSLAHDLSNAIDAGQLALFYQPIVALPSRTLCGFEALVRWQHPSMGIISPDEFIPLAEKTGLIHRIGQWVLRQSMRDWPTLRPLCQPPGNAAPFVSVNLSAPELCDAASVELIASSLRAHGMAPQELRIELTETTVIGNIAAVTHTLQTLRAMHIGIALDDFGTGYAGLDYLQTLPFSSLKIDKSFVWQMHESARSFQIIKSALELSRMLDLDTVAEGIEDAHTARVLESMGCSYAQGYHFARPMPLPDITRWAANYQAAPA